VSKKRVQEDEEGPVCRTKIRLSVEETESNKRGRVWPSRVLQIDMSFSTLYLRVRALLHDVVVTSCLKLNINNNFLSFHSPISPQPNC